MKQSHFTKNESIRCTQFLLIENSSCHIKVEISARVNYVCMQQETEKKTKKKKNSNGLRKKMQSPSLPNVMPEPGLIFLCSASRAHSPWSKLVRRL